MSNRVVRVLALAASLPLVMAAQTVVNGGRQITGTWDAAGAASTRPAKTGTSLPAACATGEQFFKTDAAAGQNLFLCTATNVWTQISGGSGGSGLPGMTGNQDKLLSNDGATAAWQALAGDISGAPNAVSVTGIRGQAVSATAAANMQALVFDGSAYTAAFSRPAFSAGIHAVDLFPYCNTALSVIGQLQWYRGGSNFTFDCPTPPSGTILSGVAVKAGAAGAYSAYLNGLFSDYANPAHSKKWTLEFEFTADAAMQTGQLSLGLADGTMPASFIALTHGSGEGFNLCMYSSGTGRCFNAAAPWDTARHTVRIERVSNSLIRAKVDGGAWYNWHSGFGTNGANDLYSVAFFATNLRPQVWANPLESVTKSFSLQRFEILYGY